MSVGTSTGSLPKAPGAPAGQRTIGVSAAPLTNGIDNADRSSRARSNLMCTQPKKPEFTSAITNAFGRTAFYHIVSCRDKDFFLTHRKHRVSIPLENTWSLNDFDFHVQPRSENLRPFHQGAGPRSALGITRFGATSKSSLENSYYWRTCLSALRNTHHFKGLFRVS